MPCYDFSPRQRNKRPLLFVCRSTALRDNRWREEEVIVFFQRDSTASCYVAFRLIVKETCSMDFIQQHLCAAPTALASQIYVDPGLTRWARLFRSFS
jgi:hypothetical protein